MKVFLLTWVGFCFLVIVGFFIAYATDRLPYVPFSQQVELEIETECLPCEENLKSLKKAMETASEEREAAAKAENLAQLKKVLEQLQEVRDEFYRERNTENRARVEKTLEQLWEAARAYYGEERFSKTQQLIDQYGTEEGLRRLRESDPDEARRFERERGRRPARDVPSGHTHPDGHSHDDSP